MVWQVPLECAWEGIVLVFTWKAILSREEVEEAMSMMLPSTTTWTVESWEVTPSQGHAKIPVTEGAGYTGESDRSEL